MLIDFNTLVNLMGIYETSHEFRSFLHDLEDSLIADFSRDFHSYAFRDYGFEITCRNVSNGNWQISSIFFHFVTASTHCKQYEPFTGRLIADICPMDRRTKIHKKLKNHQIELVRTSLVPGRKTTHGHRTDHWDEYNLSPTTTMTVICDSLNGRLGAIVVALTHNEVR